MALAYPVMVAVLLSIVYFLLMCWVFASLVMGYGRKYGWGLVPSSFKILPLHMHPHNPHPHVAVLPFKKLSNTDGPTCPKPQYAELQRPTR